jgi:hypothetical protein
MLVTLVGGPQDGHEFNLPGRFEDLPSQINVAAPPPLTWADLEAADGPIVSSPSYPVHVYRREAQRLGPLTQVRYTYEGTTS